MVCMTNQDTTCVPDTPGQKTCPSASDTYIYLKKLLKYISDEVRFSACEKSNCFIHYPKIRWVSYMNNKLTVQRIYLWAKEETYIIQTVFGFWTIMCPLPSVSARVWCSCLCLQIIAKRVSCASDYLVKGGLNLVKWARILVMTFE